MVKYLGVNVSGYLAPEGRSWESVVSSIDKLVLDKELNLSADLSSGGLNGYIRAATPSGWVAPEFLTKSAPTSSLFATSATSLNLRLFSLTAYVNGWLIPVVNTGAAGSNTLVLGAGPASAGSKRTDLVVLEVWRRLILPTTGDGKSGTGRIWAQGNVKVSVADDASLNYADDLLDAAAGIETTRRVQIQYRLRVLEGVDITSYPFGIDDPTVFASSVPASAGAPDGVVTTFNYLNQSSAGDPGLWVAGDGNPANTLGTVDGYMYATPLCGIFRRNTVAFAKNTNHNGGVAKSAVTSDRPDGLFHDIFDLKDILDLRQGISLQGWDTREVLEKNFNALLDNQLKSESAVTLVGGGVEGHTLLVADEVGVSTANGGDGSINGDTPGANLIAQFDYVRRKFSDRPIYEVMTVKLTPGGAGVSTATWQNGTVLTLQPTALTPYPYAAFNFPAFAPSQTRIVDVVGIRIAGSSGVACDVGLEQSGTGLPYVPVASVAGLGSFPMGDITITLGVIPVPLTTLSTEPVYVDLLVAYPPGQGLTYTPTEDYGSASFALNNPGTLPASAPVNFSSTTGPTFDYPHREAEFQYTTTAQTFTTTSYTGGACTSYKLPERATSLTCTVNTAPAVASVGSDGRTVTLAAPTTPSDTIVFSYAAVRPIPQTGAQFTLYYGARAPQTVRGALLGTSQKFIPRAISPHLYVLTSGSGSLGEAYPFPQAYVQTGGVSNPANPFAGEYQLNGSPAIYVGDFSSQTGLLRVPTYIGYTPDPQYVQFDRVLGDVDIEGRSFFPSVPSGQYIPNSYGNQLADSRVHKTLLPCLMEASEDSSLGKKGALYLVLLSRWADFDAKVGVEFNLASPGSNTTVASIYRLNGNLLNRKA